MFSFYDMVKASTATSGSGSITVGAAVSPYRAFSGIVADGATVRYLILDGTAWERGYGVYTSSTGVLTRNLECSSTGSLLSLSGSATVEIVFGAADANEGPAFSAYRTGAAQSLPTWTFTIIQLNAELFDTSNCFDSATNYRFTPNIAGYYQLNGNIAFDPGITSTTVLVSIFKNGVEAFRGSRFIAYNTSQVSCVVSGLIYLNGSTDYVDLRGYHGKGSDATLEVSVNSEVIYFNGFLARKA